MNIAETAAQLQTIQQAMILIHQSPDGDCIGSGYALAALLRQMGCHAVVRCSDPIPERYAFLTVEETPDTVDEDAAVILSVDVAAAGTKTGRTAACGSGTVFRYRYYNRKAAYR